MVKCWMVGEMHLIWLNSTFPVKAGRRAYYLEIVSVLCNLKLWASRQFQRWIMKRDKIEKRRKLVFSLIITSQTSPKIKLKTQGPQKRSNLWKAKMKKLPWNEWRQRLSWWLISAWERPYVLPIFWSYRYIHRIDTSVYTYIRTSVYPYICISDTSAVYQFIDSHGAR